MLLNLNKIDFYFWNRIYEGFGNIIILGCIRVFLCGWIMFLFVFVICYDL